MFCSQIVMSSVELVLRHVFILCQAGCRLVALLVLSELLNQPEHAAASDDG